MDNYNNYNGFNSGYDQEPKPKKKYKRRRQKGQIVIIPTLLVLCVAIFVIFTDNPFAHKVQDKVGLDFYITIAHDDNSTRQKQADHEFSTLTDTGSSLDNIGSQASNMDPSLIVASNTDSTNQQTASSNAQSAQIPSGVTPVLTQNSDGDWVERYYLPHQETESISSSSCDTSNPPSTTQPIVQQPTTSQGGDEVVAPIVISPTTQQPTSGGSGETYPIDANAYANASTMVGQYSNVRTELLNQINTLRSNNGLSPVSLNDTLSTMAGYRVYDMGANNYFSHTKDGVSQLRVVMYAYNSSGKHYENLGRAVNEEESYLASSTVTGWINSSSHYSVMVNGSLTQIGIAVNKVGDTWYICTIYN